MAKKRNKSIHCPNCNFQFKEVNNFCPQCGQENHSHNVPLKELFFELLETTFHFDTKLLLTLKTGFLKPGKVISDFIAGKRARYVPPFKFYIFISIIFFIALGFFSGNKDADNNDLITINNKLDSVATDSFELKQDAIYTYKDSEDKDSLEITKEKLQIVLDSVAFSGGGSEFEKTLSEKLKHLLGNDKKDMYAKFTKLTSYFMFFFMPFSALYLVLLYIRKNRNYYEHLVFSIYTHTYVFIIFTLGIIISHFLKGDATKIVMFVAGVIYFLLSLKNVYQQSWPKTIFKFMAVSFLYLFTGFILLLFFILGGIYFT